MTNTSPTDDEPVAAVAISAPCWRCGLDVPSEANACPHCAAHTNTSPVINQPVGVRRRIDPFKLLFWSYGLLLTTGIVHAFVLADTIDENAKWDLALRDRVLWQILIVEAIDTCVIAVTLLLWVRPASCTSTTKTVRIASWLAGIPLLGALLTLNLGYHWLLRHVVGLPLISDELAQDVGVLSLLAVCVQPAVVEEAYCRLFVLDSLAGVTGRHAAVWISATMFAFLHVAVLPSIPYLIVVGAVLAYLRLASGTLLLPITLHFFHNLIVLLYFG